MRRSSKPRCATVGLFAALTSWPSLLSLTACSDPQGRSGDAAASMPDGTASAGETSPSTSTASDCAVTVDRDADGVVKTEVSACSATASVPRPFDNVEDCDDADPARSRTLFVDEDGDGAGIGAGQCLPNAGAGFATAGGDCDDADAAVWPLHDDEAPFDGKDGDCDGNDFPERNALNLPEPGPLATIDANVRCRGRALSILASEVFGGCAGGIVLQIGNRGSETVSGAVLHLLPAGGNAEAEFIALPELQSGSVVRTQRIFGRHTVRIENAGDPGECEPLGEVGDVVGLMHICQ